MNKEYLEKLKIADKAMQDLVNSTEVNTSQWSNLTTVLFIIKGMIAFSEGK